MIITIINKINNSTLTPEKKKKLTSDPTYLGVSEDGVVDDAGEEDLHDVGAVVQGRDPRRLQVGGEVGHVGL